MILVPNSAGAPEPDRFVEFNTCHTPGGSGRGGQFCSDRDAFLGVPRVSATQMLAGPYGALGPTVLAARQHLSKLMARDGNEHMVIVQEGEHPFYFTSGNDKFVQLPEGMRESLTANPPTWTAHTHPTGSAPSHADIRMQISTKTPKQVIVGDGGEWYELTVTDFAKAEAVIGKGRRRATYWDDETKGPFQASFDRLKKQVSKESARMTDAWAAKEFGWTATTQGGRDGFLIDGVFLSRKAAGDQEPRLRKYHSARFSELSPRIWLTLAKKHADWLTFRMHRTTGPYATTNS